MTKQAVDAKNPIPRYLQVRQILEERIRSGLHRPGSQLPGERELARELRVSQMTVNKAILALVNDGWLYREHGKGTFVREDFRPPLPEVLQLGVVIHSDIRDALEDFYLGTLFRGMQCATERDRASLSILGAPGDTLYERLRTAPMDGFLVVDPREQDIASVNRLLHEGKRIIALSAFWPQLEAPLVDCDNRTGAAAAVEHLVALGHRRIAGVFTLMSSCHTQHRLGAYLDTLRNHNIHVPEPYIVTSGDVFPLSEEARQQVYQLLRLPRRPTAFFCGGYYLALEVMQAIREEGLRIPDDVSVVGFEDPVSAAHLTPPLTTVRQPLGDMGHLAAMKLLDWIKTHGEPPRSVVLRTGLVVRGSTAPTNEQI